MASLPPWGAEPGETNDEAIQALAKYKAKSPEKGAW